jgi:hypothetical protein
MKFVRRQEVEIDEKALAKELSDSLYDALTYQDCDFAEDIESSDYEIQRLAILNKVGEIWHEEFLKAIIDKKITSDKEIWG